MKRQLVKQYRRRPPLPRCQCCHKCSYPDAIAAKVDGAYWDQRAYACPAGFGWHLSSRDAWQERHGAA